MSVSVGLGLSLPAEERLPPLAEVGRLDHSPSVRGSFRPLRAGFVNRVLGLGGPFGGGPFGGPSPVAFGRSRDFPFGDGSALPDRGRRTTVSHGLTNDHMRDALVVPSVPFTAKTNNASATREPAEPAGCSPTGGGTVWYQYTPKDSRVLVATTFGSDHATAVAVFVGAGDGRRQIGCDLDPIGAAQVVFSVEASQTYSFQVTAPRGGGDLAFNLDPLGVTRRVSVSSDGKEADGVSAFSGVSADGRYAVFVSGATNLVEGDTNTCGGYVPSCFDAFVHDTISGRTERVSVASDGTQANHATTGQPAISGDGRHVAFLSLASNLVPGDTNEQWDVFVHDRLTKVTERISVDSAERESRRGHALPRNDPNSTLPSISLSHDGRYVAFASDAPDLVPNDDNACFDTGIVDWGGSVQHTERPARAPAELVGYNCRDVFVRDRRAGTTTRVSIASDGTEGEGDSASAYITPDGRYVAFTSDAENLDARDHNGYRDVFVHDRATRRTEIASLSSSGAQGNSNSGGFNERGDTSISGDGRYVAFISHASNFADADGHDQNTFLRDRVTGRTVMLPNPPQFAEADSDWLHAAMSRDGRFVAASIAVPEVRAGETRHLRHIVVYDRVADRTTLVSVSSFGEEANDIAYLPDISADGRVVVFQSSADNLVADDTARLEDVFLHEMPWAR